MEDRPRPHLIVFGPPDEIDAHPSGGQYKRPMEEGGGETSTYPFEDWRYRYIEGDRQQEVIIEFVDPCMCGDYHMTIDPNEKDALLHTPGAGLTMYEQMGMASKADRIAGIGNSTPARTRAMDTHQAVRQDGHVGQAQYAPRSSSRTWKKSSATRSTST